MRRVALIYNRAAGRGSIARRLDAVLAALRQTGLAVEPAPTGGPGGATKLARQAAEAGGFGAVLAFGGDGTVREVAAGLLGTEVPLGILPGGTVNLLARTLGLPAEPVAAAAALPRLVARPFDVGLAGETPFLMMVSAGLDAALLAALNTGWKRRFGRAGVMAQGLTHWWSYAYHALELEADGRHSRASFAAVANIPFYGGPYRLVPQARPDDGRLDLLLFTGIGRIATLGFAADLLRNAHVRRNDVTVVPVEEVILHGPEGAVAQVDGDLCRETLPVRIRLSPTPLSVLAGAPSPREGGAR